MEVQLLATRSNPVIMASVPNVNSPVYIDQPITITCATYRTHVLAWESDKYIGPGGQLVFASSTTVGMIRDSEIMNQTFAILTGVTTEGGEVQLESQLHLTVSPKHQNFTIVCKNVDQDLADNVTFHTSGEGTFVILTLPIRVVNYH